MSKDVWKIIGLDKLKRDLGTLPILKQASLLRNANRRAGNKIVVKKLIDAIPHKSKKVRRRTKKNPFKIVTQKQAITANVKGSKTAINAGISSKYFHYRFIEFGTQKRTTRKKKMNRGVMQSRPFANSVLDRSINPLFRYLKTDYGKILDKSIQKVKNK